MKLPTIGWPRAMIAITAVITLPMVTLFALTTDNVTLSELAAVYGALGTPLVAIVLGVVAKDDPPKQTPPDGGA